MIPQELLLAASLIADSRGLEIIEAAQFRLAKTRFNRLRKRLTYPQTEQEYAYMQALGQYVLRKMRLKRQQKREDYGCSHRGCYSYFSGKSAIEEEMRHYRQEMDRIEFNGGSTK